MTLLVFPARDNVTASHSPIERPHSGLLVRPDRDARFYDGEARPVLTVPYADRKRRGERRPVTLADARKLGLYPSTMYALSIIDQPGLHAWQASQYIEAALTLPRLPGESLDAFAERVVEDGQAYRNAARDAGRELHYAIADYLQGSDAYAYRGDWSAHLRGFAAWWEQSGLRCLAAEHRFVNREHGYGGTVDCLASDRPEGPDGFEDLVIIDWKSQATEPGKPVRYYDEWAMQLAAYAHTPGIRLMSGVVSRTEPGRVEVKEWDDRERWWACFHAALCLWKLVRDYFPGAGA